MRLLSRLLSAYLLRRLLAGGRHRGRRWSAPPPRHARRRAGRMRMVGPFPTYSTRTRRGSRVTVSGCCLPIPLTLAAGVALGARGVLRR
ncbi:MAG TPA: hypothetical protein VHF51_09090 [Solirubrobacteraceae bacterium]|nr:hypothetical protein [Solirubrobacteraceae bacterium]